MLRVDAGGAVSLLDVASTAAAAAPLETRAAFEEAIDYRHGQVAIAQHMTPGRQRFVAGDGDRELAEAAFVDDAIAHVGGVDGVREIADLVEHEDVRLQVRLERGVEGAETRGVRPFADQHVRRHEARREAVPQGARGERNDQMRFPSSGRATKSCAPPVGHAFGAMRDLFSDQRVEIRAVAHALGFGAHRKLGMQPPDGSQVQALQHCIEIQRLRAGQRR